MAMSLCWASSAYLNVENSDHVFMALLPVSIMSMYDSLEPWFAWLVKVEP